MGNKRGEMHLLGCEISGKDWRTRVYDTRHCDVTMRERRRIVVGCHSQTVTLNAYVHTF